ncbi:MAG TPA: DUF2336 domain-containing protein [Xanthobacteraceae bacterium]|nr:DUF2336 domain-containing protein [Xanthobacteraceae bacterium]
MDYLRSFPALESLVDLATRDEVDINPTLLRVLTDLYVTKPRHSRDEERQYTELVLRLLDVVDVAARHRLAQKLADYPSAPAAVVRRLARDVIAVAEPILRHSRVLSRAEMLAIAQKTGPRHVAVLVGEEFEPQTNKTAAADDLFSGITATASELNELFFTADAFERRLILLHLDYVRFAPAKPVEQPIAREAVRRLELAAFSHSVESFARELARSLAISHAQARRIAADPLGEPIVIASKALGMSAEVLQRVLLCLNPAIGHSVQRVYDLAALYEHLKPEAALRMLAIWQAMAHKPPFAAHAPQYVEDKARVRPDAAASQRRPIPRPADRRNLTRRG